MFIKLRQMPSSVQKSFVRRQSKKAVVTPAMADPQIKPEVATFANQSKLPRLPIPELNSSIDKFKKTVLPLARSKEEWNEFERKMEKFRKDAGPILQDRLKKFAAGEKNNWLDRMWLAKAYCEYRESSVINVSYWMAFTDHPMHPKDLLENPPPQGTFSPFQIKRAAGLTNNLLTYKEMIEKELIPPEPNTCMHQYKLFFGATRIPVEKCDKVITPFPSKARHIVLLIKEIMYKVQVLGNDGERIPLETIEKSFMAAVQDAQKNDDVVPVGRLGTANRDAYTSSYNHLLSLSGKNKENMKIVEDALFCVALDDYTIPGDINEWHHQIFHGGAHCHNRFIDKEIQFIVTNNGRAGNMGEHAPADAAVPSYMFDWVLSREPSQTPFNAVAGVQVESSKRLNWDADEKVWSDIQAAEREVGRLISTVDSIWFKYEGYGAGWIKKACKVSPDAFAQMCLQLTFARMYPHPTATYETASTRQFLWGRTETTRVCSVDSEKFARSFDSKTLSAGEKLKRLRDACTAHIAYSKGASAGQGVDRHFLGLKVMCSKEWSGQEDLKLPELFSDPVYQRSFHHRISTSNLSLSSRIFCGFGAVVPDGYGSNYNLQDGWMSFSLSSYYPEPSTDSGRFQEELLKVFGDVREIVEKGVVELGEVGAKL